MPVPDDIAPTVNGLRRLLMSLPRRPAIATVSRRTMATLADEGKSLAAFTTNTMSEPIREVMICGTKLIITQRDDTEAGMMDFRDLDGNMLWTMQRCP
jgi:hypothetical protein